jgi:hypothetical protein
MNWFRRATAVWPERCFLGVPEYPGALYRRGRARKLISRVFRRRALAAGPPNIAKLDPLETPMLKKGKVQAIYRIY